MKTELLVSMTFHHHLSLQRTNEYFSILCTSDLFRLKPFRFLTSVVCAPDISHAHAHERTRMRVAGFFARNAQGDLIFL